MKIGDRIKVIELYDLDINSNIEIGDTGVIDSFTKLTNVILVNVVLDKDNTEHDERIEINKQGTYPIYQNQLKIIR